MTPGAAGGGSSDTGGSGVLQGPEDKCLCGSSLGDWNTDLEKYKY